MMSGPVPVASATVSFWLMSPEDVTTGLMVTFGRTFLYASINSFTYAVNGPYSCHQISMVTFPFGKLAGALGCAPAPPATSVSTAAIANEDTVRLSFDMAMFCLPSVDCFTAEPGQVRTFPVAESNTWTRSPFGLTQMVSPVRNTRRS